MKNITNTHTCVYVSHVHLTGRTLTPVKTHFPHHKVCSMLQHREAIPAAKLDCAAETGLEHSASLSVTSGEAKPTRPL